MCLQLQRPVVCITLCCIAPKLVVCLFWQQAIDEEEGVDLCDCEFSLAYGAKILLNNTRLRLKKGRRYGLCGPNGAGKVRGQAFRPGALPLACAGRLCAVLPECYAAGACAPSCSLPGSRLCSVCVACKIAGSWEDCLAVWERCMRCAQIPVRSSREA